ncbi:SPFH domain-containing protein [Vibrio sp. D431a]|uniref:SPFH domain-containing protein n=1 Tax=Vibrio sp. D431a TaxID=2837388 RepID=UPI002553A171|nr:SPFH domain-containing protein [Vibrio sp. D431a]MDK9793275.1 hypothetical protein [Vibrio sp. D431a]
MLGIPTWFLVLGGAVIAILAFLASCYKKVKGQGWMLVINGAKKTRATSNGTFIIPLIDTPEHVRVTDRTIEVRREGQAKGWLEGDHKQGLSCKDGVRVNIIATFYVKFPKYDQETICSITNRLTSPVINDDAALSKFLSPILNETLKNVVIKHDYETLMTDRNTFSDDVKAALNNQLHGLDLEKVAINEIQHSHIDSHDPDNVYDAKGIEKIKEITSEKFVRTQEIEQQARTDAKQHEVSGENARKQLELDMHQKAEAIEREKAITTQNEHKLAKEAEIEATNSIAQKSIQSEQDIAQAQQNKEAAIEGAKVDVERKVTLAKVASEKESNLAREDAKRELVQRSSTTEMERETANLNVSEVRAKRVEVERQTAVQEEETLDLRTERKVARNQTEVVGDAEAVAMAEAKKDTIRSETALKVESQDAERRRICAQADFEVEEQKAKSLERTAEANIANESSKGIAEAKVLSAKAESSKAQGLAEAEVIKAKGAAEANSQKAIREAMNVDEDTRKHEVGLAQMQIDKEIELHRIDKQAEVGVASAEGMAKAYSGANVTLLGNNNDFAQAFFNAKSDALVAEQHPVFGSQIQKYKTGDANPIDDIQQILGNTSLGDLLNLSLIQKGGAQNLSEAVALSNTLSQGTKPEEFNANSEA